MTQKLSKLFDEQLQAALVQCQAENPWKLSNDILYKLCKDYPKHTEPQEIVAKTLMIGRVYAAALERIKAKNCTPAMTFTSTPSHHFSKHQH